MILISYEGSNSERVETEKIFSGREREMFKYKLMWIRMKEKYYYKPKRKYVEIPWAQIKVWFKRFKKINTIQKIKDIN